MKETAEGVRFEGLLKTTRLSSISRLQPKVNYTLQNNHSKHITTDTQRNTRPLNSLIPLTSQYRLNLTDQQDANTNRPIASKMRMLQLRAMKLNQQKNTSVGARLEELLSRYSKSVLSVLAPSRDQVEHKPSVRAKSCTKFRFLPSLGATSFLTLITLICLEMILLSTVSNCAKTFYMHWNTSNSIFRIDNTDHIIDVNKGNLAFEFDQVHIICPVYEPGTFENETEKYIIYNVSKVEYETCRITNADPRVIAICDKPQKLMFFTITFRPFTPQPGGLEFLPGNDYYFISTSSKDDLYRRIGGRCSTNNMKVVFKVCCAPEEKNKTTTASTTSIDSGSPGSETDVSHPIDVHSSGNSNNKNNNNQQHNTINTFGGVGGSGGGININSANNNGIQLKPLNVGGSTGTSINTNIDQFNRIPMQTNGINVIGHNIGPMGGDPHSGILLTPGNVGHGGINMIPASGGYNPGLGGQYYPGQTTTGIRINNVPSQYHPSHKHNNNNDDHYDKHPNEVVKNEELTYNSKGSTIHRHCWSWRKIVHFEAILIAGSSSLVTNVKRSLMKLENLIISLIFNPLVLLTIFFVTIVQYQFFNTSYNLPFAKVESDKRRSKQSENCMCSKNLKLS